MRIWIAIGMLMATTVAAYADPHDCRARNRRVFRTGCDGPYWFNRGAHLGTQAQKITVWRWSAAFNVASKLHRNSRAAFITTRTQPRSS